MAPISWKGNRGNAPEEAKQKVDLIKEIRAHEVAMVELDTLSSSKAVYQKNGNIYFRTTTLKARTSEQKLLDQSQMSTTEAEFSMIST